MQSAVGMLRDQNEDLSRSRKRIEILLGLFSKEDELKGVCCRECPWASGDHQNTSVRSLGTQGSWLSLQTRGISLECVSMLQSVDGCRAFPDVQVVVFSLAVLAGFFPS